MSKCAVRLLEARCLPLAQGVSSDGREIFFGTDGLRRCTDIPRRLTAAHGRGLLGCNRHLPAAAGRGSADSFTIVSCSMSA